jgi:hypothetical protein
MDPQHRPLVSWPNHGARHRFGVPCAPIWVVLDSSAPTPADAKYFAERPGATERRRPPFAGEFSQDIPTLPADAVVVLVRTARQWQRWLVEGGC